MCSNIKISFYLHQYAYSQHFISFVACKSAQKARVFVPDKTFQTRKGMCKLQRKRNDLNLASGSQFSIQCICVYFSTQLKITHLQEHKMVTFLHR
jgi:hypothetical protein